MNSIMFSSAGRGLFFRLYVFCFKNIFFNIKIHLLISFPCAFIPHISLSSNITLCLEVLHIYLLILLLYVN